MAGDFFARSLVQNSPKIMIVPRNATIFPSILNFFIIYLMSGVSDSRFDGGVCHKDATFWMIISKVLHDFDDQNCHILYSQFVSFVCIEYFTELRQSNL